MDHVHYSSVEAGAQEERYSRELFSGGDELHSRTPMPLFYVIPKTVFGRMAGSCMAM